MLPGMCARPEEFGGSIETCRKLAEREKGTVFSAMTWQVIRRIRNRRNGMYDVGIKPIYKK